MFWKISFYDENLRDNYLVAEHLFCESLGQEPGWPVHRSLDIMRFEPLEK